MEMIGYCFIPTQRMKLERSLMLYGPSANGKGVVFDIVVAILGEKHVSGFLWMLCLMTLMLAHS